MTKEPAREGTHASDPPRWSRWAVLVVTFLLLIIVPFAIFGDALDRWSLSALDALAANPIRSSLLIVGLLASDVVLPIPSSVVSTVSGVVLGFAPGAATSFLGMTFGCMVGYAIGKTAGSSLAQRLVGPVELTRLKRVIARHGDWSLVVTRAVPVLAEASVVFAGMGSMRMSRFFAMTALSNMGISMAYAGVGAYAAEVRSFLLAVAGAVLLPVVAMGVSRLTGRDSVARAGSK